MDLYLSQNRSCLNRLDDYESVCVVLGSEACDLDSAVSTLVYAQFLSYCNKYGADTPHIPVLNIHREDFPIKTEVVHFLAKVGISSDHIVFRNDINLASLNMKKKLKLVLVDHNTLKSSDCDLDSSIVEIIDHHKVEHPLSDKITMVVEPVASCCTLVSSLILEQVPNFLKTDSATLLMGTIVLDVDNFYPSFKRVTGKDSLAFDRLSAIIPDVSKDDIYKELQTAKANITGLKLDQMLRKDVKIIHSDDVVVAVSTVPLLANTLLETYSDIDTKLHNFCNTYNYQAVIVIGINLEHQTDTAKCDILVFSANSSLKNKICHGLEDGQESLKRILTEHQCDLVLYHQTNVMVTQKTILPMLKDILQKESKGSYGIPLISSIVEESSGNSSIPNSGLFTPTNSILEDSEVQTNSLPMTKLSVSNLSDILAKLELMLSIPGRNIHEDPLCLSGTPINGLVEDCFEDSNKICVFNLKDMQVIAEKLRQENFFPEECDV